MKNLIFPVSIIAVLAFAVSSCKKETKCVGGAGGNTTIVAFPKHHGADTKPLWAYVKYNTQEFPGVDAWLYDATIAGDTTENHIELENLKCGDYYIYMIAIDPAINDTVVGGIPFSTEAESGEVNATVAVTE